MESKEINPKYPLLKNAPIVEALLDIRVELPESKTLDDLYVISEKIRDRFPLEKKRYRFSSSFEIKSDKKEVSSEVSNSLADGYLFYSENKKKVCQSRLDGFTFNQHKPYENWGKLLDEAKVLWELYKSSAEPISIKRIALRFINKINLKMPFAPSDYFSTMTYLGTGSRFGNLEYDINNLFTQITIDNPDINAIAHITEGVETDGSDNAQFLFDIDVIKNLVIEESKIWDHFDDLRNFKNEIFFKSLTEKTLTLLG